MSFHKRTYPFIFLLTNIRIHDILLNVVVDNKKMLTSDIFCSIIIHVFVVL
ncbi:Predicted protein [Anoxybacillus flavithermus WK1]|uniref:Uncharacterized protein n=1 Tax=Anoxybacillus flavithermus (strain DSM 21510 / WK1) TaxID=491915 RepID=B7GFF6_ANOFW|nr:Predicted protein [Anoxybacillus flavithermus WK1]